MQLTRFDQWLRRRFVHETHIYTLSDPGEVPRGVCRKPLPENPGRRFNHWFVVRNEKTAEQFITMLKSNNQMYNTRVYDRKGLLASVVAPAGKSFTWKCVWMVVGGIGATSVVRYVMGLWSDPEIQENLKGALEILKS
jgi:hypothetical protein